MDDNVLKMPTKLDRLADRISSAMKKRDESHEAWIASTLEIGASLLEARNEFKDDISFGKWCDATFKKLNHQDRAAYVKMASDPNQFREVLEKTGRKSIQHICDKEFRFTQVSKPRGRKKGMKLTKPTQKALDAIQKAKADGRKIKSQRALAKEIGVSETAIRRAAVIDDLLPDEDTTPLTPSNQEKLEAYKRRYEKEFDQRVLERAHEMTMNNLKARYNALNKEAEEIGKLLKRRHPFSRDEYKAILKVIHPDMQPSKEQKDEAFKLINAREKILQPTKEDDLKERIAHAEHEDGVRWWKAVQAWKQANPNIKTIPPELRRENFNKDRTSNV